jgi:exosome complex component RRP46
LIISEQGKTKTLIQNPSIVEIRKAASVHVLAFTSHGSLLVNESKGNFSTEDWERVYDEAERICCGTEATRNHSAMQDDRETDGGMMEFVKSTLQEKVEADLHWRG